MIRFSQPLHVGRPNLAPRDAILAKIDQVLASNWLTNDGPMVRQLESEICLRTGAKHAICVANGTLALEFCYRLLDVKGTLLMPSFTFVATAHAAKTAGHNPSFCEIDAKTHCLDARDLPHRYSEATVGLVCVDTWGRDSVTEPIARWAKDAGLPIVVDAAHSFPAMRHRPGHDHHYCWSFHATKLFNCSEGGAITTDSDDVAERLRLMRNFGFTGLDEVAAWGTNAKMNEVSAAIGLANLSYLESFCQRCAENRDAYSNSLKQSDAFDWSSHENESGSNHHYAVAMIRPEYTHLRDAVVKLLWEANVRARRYFWPGVHKMEPYRTMFAELSLPTSDDIASRVIVLPNGPDVTPGIAAQIVDCMESSVSRLCSGRLAA